MRRKTKEEKQLARDVEALIASSNTAATGREAALQRLVQLGPSGVDAYVSRIDGLKRERYLLPVRLAVVLVTGWAATWCVDRLLGVPNLPATWFSGLGAATSVAFTWFRNRNRAMKNLSVFDDVRTLGLLVEGLASSSASVRSTCRATVLRLLPRLTPADASLISSHQQDRLFRRIVGDDVELAQAALNASNQLSALASLPYVEQLAARKPRVDVPDGKMVTDAMRLLPQLRERAERELQSEKLLRPVFEIQQETTLVRPAAGAVAADEVTLLRPAIGE